MDRQKIASSFREVQEFICSKLEKIDGKSIFESDEWSRSEGGGGRTNTIKDGNIIEKGGVAFSEVFGPVSEQMSKQLNLDGSSFFCHRCFYRFTFKSSSASYYSYEYPLF